MWSVTVFTDTDSMKVYDYYKKRCASVEIMKHSILQRRHFRVKNRVCL